jgi:c-di-GMP-binding flagellar brake protein YcgR
MSTEDDPRDRRGTGRQEGGFPYQLVIGKHEYEGTTRNLSMGGALIELPGGAESNLLDQSGFMTIVINSLPYEGACTVVRVAASGAGIRFDDIKGSALEEAIFSFIEDELEDL